MPRVIESAHDPTGAYQRTCPQCGIVFRTNNCRVKYCSKKCYKKVQNERYYQKNRQQIIDSVIRRREADDEAFHAQIEREQESHCGR